MQCVNNFNKMSLKWQFRCAGVLSYQHVLRLSTHETYDAQLLVSLSAAYAKDV